MTEPFLQDADVTLYCGDVLDVLRKLPDESVHMACTSPPFYGLRDYGTGTWEGGDEGCDHKGPPKASERSGLKNDGRPPEQVGQNDYERGAAVPYRDVCGKCGAQRVDQQIGLEATPDQWVARLVEVFREVRRVLRADGTLWVEIGDSYNAYNGNRGPSASISAAADAGRNAPERGLTTTAAKPKDLIGAPWLLAKALQAPYYTGKIKDEKTRLWLAAMVDTEGCIAIHNRPAGTKNYAPYTRKDGTKAEYRRKNDSYQPKVEISNTSLAIIDRIIELTGEGHTETKQEAGTFGRKQTCYRWTLTADKARDFLREIYPHLVAKQHEARLAIGCPSSGEDGRKAWESLKALHQGHTASMDFAPPEGMWERGWFLRSEIIWAKLDRTRCPRASPTVLRCRIRGCSCSRSRPGISTTRRRSGNRMTRRGDKTNG